MVVFLVTKYQNSCKNPPPPLTSHHLSLQFGHGLQQLLTVVPYSEIAGQRNIEWDALQTVGMVMARIAFNRHVMQQISYHVDTGEQIPLETINTVLAGERCL